MTDNLYDLLLERLEGIPYNGYFMADCPFHDWQSHTQSLMVHEDAYKCLSCGAYGNLKKLLDKTSRGIFRPQREKRASNILPRWSKWERNYGDLDGIVEHAHLSLKRFPQFQAYFKKRKIDQFIEQGKFGYLDGWALFPVFAKDGKIIDIVVRATVGKGLTRYVLHPDTNRQSPYLYVPNWYRVNSLEFVYVVFGIVDAWAMEDLGLACVTGTSGKSLNYELLKDLDKQFVIVPDKHEEKEAYNLANKLGWRGDVRLISYPSDAKDPDSVRTKYGNEALIRLIGA